MKVQKKQQPQEKKERGLYVEVTDFGRDSHATSVGEALKELSKKMKKAEVFLELKEREHYTKPSVKRRLAKNNSIRRSFNERNK
jgi:ribosomal protein S21